MQGKDFTCSAATTAAHTTRKAKWLLTQANRDGQCWPLITKGVQMQE